MKMFKGAMVVAAATAFAIAGSVNADIIFLTDQNQFPTDEENILFQQTGTIDGPALLVTGETQDTGLSVFFRSDELIETVASGQARIQAASDGDPQTDEVFQFLELGVQGGTFHDFIFNLNIFSPGGPPTTGQVTVTVTEANGDVTQFLWDVTSAGQNFAAVEAINGQRIQTISLSGDVPISFLDFRQPRISGVFECPRGSTDPLCTGEPGGQIPEPGSLALLGAGIVAMGFLRRRRRD